ncbi:mechanosensitive ion channel family protein [Algiphilus sp. W345]|uniref:Mechanosensitive ion channel family protein n=1 Tax=Banduia mediterranea TaxID=3075609 RepID=A0ABU2WHW9_9GAMM|nr:mechanosensitive ion channel family protein [Algiphilus sp. W345]MDT0496677.1 mechanosensitive ion channel family protein [Algiphilus sp. W345]
MPEVDLQNLEALFLGNPLRTWMISAGVVVLIIAVAFSLKWVVVNRLSRLAERSRFAYDDAIVAAVRVTRMWLVFFPAVLIGTQGLDLPDKLANGMQKAAALAVFVQLGIWLSAMLRHVIDHSRAKAMETDPGTATSLSALSFVGKMLLWAVILLLALDNMGIDVTAMVAGLGVGGIAVALAVQNILGDLFASLSIIVDKPFVIGDFIIVDSYMGSVENIGLKTTRIRSLGGEQIVFSNSDLLNTRIRNYKRMRERRIVFKFGVLYSTPADQLEAIPTMVREIIEDQQTVRFDRAHFQGFGDSSLNFEAVYWMLDPDFNLYMDRQQAINLALVRKFAPLGIDFAFPTRTLHVEGPIRVEPAQGQAPEA